MERGKGGETAAVDVFYECATAAVPKLLRLLQSDPQLATVRNYIDMPGLEESVSNLFDGSPVVEDLLNTFANANALAAYGI